MFSYKSLEKNNFKNCCEYAVTVKKAGGEPAFTNLKNLTYEKPTFEGQR
jgi:hypothetical protein